MVKVRLGVAAALVVVIVLPLTLALRAEPATEGVGDKGDVDSVQIEIKAVISDGDKEERVLDYSFDIAANQELAFHNGETIPLVTNTVSRSEGDTITAQQVDFVDVGVLIRLTPSVQDGKILLASKVEFSKLDSWSREKKPIIKRCRSEATTVHTDAKPLRVLSGDYLDQKKSITISIKAVHPRLGKK